MRQPRFNIGGQGVFDSINFYTLVQMSTFVTVKTSNAFVACILRMDGSRHLNEFYISAIESQIYGDL